MPRRCRRGEARLPLRIGVFLRGKGVEFPDDANGALDFGGRVLHKKEHLCVLVLCLAAPAPRHLHECSGVKVFGARPYDADIGGRYGDPTLEDRRRREDRDSSLTETHDVRVAVVRPGRNSRGLNTRTAEELRQRLRRIHVGTEEVDAAAAAEAAFEPRDELLGQAPALERGGELRNANRTRDGERTAVKSPRQEKHGVSNEEPAQKGYGRGGRKVDDGGTPCDPPDASPEKGFRAQGKCVRFVYDDEGKGRRHPQRLVYGGEDEGRQRKRTGTAAPIGAEGDFGKGGGKARGELVHDVAARRRPKDAPSGPQDVGQEGKEDFGLPRPRHRPEEKLRAPFLRLRPRSNDAPP